jgi:DNA helicase-2/ATP-dependent DNA helicase PcrA
MHTDVAHQNPSSMTEPKPQPSSGPRKRLTTEQILAGLTEPQAAAVQHTEGPLLVLAGPGSGKTRVITRRIAYLIQIGIPAWQILAVTFTNKAAAEMRERVTHLLGEGTVARGLTVTTFHALCARLLRKYADIAKLAGLTGTFAIYDSDDQSATVKRAIEGLNLSTSNWPARSVLSQISAAKNELIDAQAFERDAFDFNTRTLAKIYAAYQRLLRAANAVDFDDLLLLTAQMLKTNAQVREACRDRWQYLLVDEYQDTNKAQFQIAALLAGSGASSGSDTSTTGADEEPASERRATQSSQSRNICVVGDPDQSIYGWRGADISNILQFETVFPGTKTIALGENFRSTRHIITAADHLIRNNTERKHKDLFTSNHAGDKIEVVICRDEHHEARLVVDWLKRLKEDRTGRVNWKDLAVFYRTNALSRVVEDVLRNEGIPYTIARGTAFYQREEIKHALAYLRVVANPQDDVSLLRIVNTPARGIGDTTLDRVQAYGAEKSLTALDALRVGPAALGLPARASGAIDKFVKMVDAWAGIHEEGMLTAPAAEGSLAELVERVIRESGLEAMYKAGGDTEAERLENLSELVSSAREFEIEYDPSSDPAADVPFNPDEETDIPAPSLLQLLRAYLERVALVADTDAIDPAQGAMTLMTLHAAKGLEFAGVAMIGLEEGLLPHSRVQTNPKELEEERRLCFVGITRAMRRLLITSSRYRTVRGITERTMVSRFIDELPKENIAASDQAGFSEPGWDEGNERASGYSNDGPRFVPDRVARPKGAMGVKDINGKVLEIGCSVRHPQFGLGRISSISSEQGGKATVQFRQVGSKTLILQYARLERMD